MDSTSSPPFWNAPRGSRIGSGNPPPVRQPSSVKTKEKTIGLHINVISQMAIGRDMDVQVVPKGGGTFCNVHTGKITIEDLSDDIDILIGLAFHETGHAIATSAIDYHKEFKVPKEDESLLHHQVNSLEDYRIERKMAQIYPPAEYYLKKMAHWWRLEGSKDRMIGEMTANPQFPLHLNLGNIDITRFMKKEPRTEVRKLTEELCEMKFDEFPSTRSLVPVAMMILERLKPFIPEDERQQYQMVRIPLLPCNSGFDHDVKDREEHPPMENIGKAGEFQQGEVKEETGIPHLDFLKAVDKLTDEKEAEGPANVKVKTNFEGKPPSAKENQDYVRPCTPEVKKITTCEEYKADGIDQEVYSAEEGKKIGMKLMQELKFKEAARHRLDDGELNVDTVIENMQENRGRLSDFNVFSDETPLVHDHSVCILIDMSGSMCGQAIRIARSAALMLASALEEMNVPYSIRGFGAVHGELLIEDHVIKDFDDQLSLPKLRSMFMGEVNRDSDSIRNALQVLSSERGKKLLFVISDGHPNHSDGVDDYRSYNEQAFMDTYHVVRQAEAEGVSVIGIGIERSAAEFISRAYLKGFFIEDIHQLPTQLIDIYLKESAGFRSWKSMLL